MEAESGISYQNDIPRESDPCTDSHILWALPSEPHWCGSHYKDAIKTSYGSDRGRTSIIIIEHAQSLFYTKDILSRRKIFMSLITAEGMVFLHTNLL
jgi:hypothetical protein